MSFSKFSLCFVLMVQDGSFLLLSPDLHSIIMNSNLLELQAQINSSFYKLSFGHGVFFTETGKYTIHRFSGDKVY